MKPSTREQLRALRSIREYVHTRTLVRYPVSTFRRRLGLLALACFVAGFGFYTLSTTDQAIRDRALSFLRKATPGGVEIEVGGASFRMFEGITLSNVRMYVPYDERVDPAAKSRKDREIFSAASLQLVHDPWQLLIGNLRVKRVLAVRPTIVLTNNIETGARNWELLIGSERKRSRLPSKNRPVVTIRSAIARVISIRPNGDRVESEQVLDADVRPTLQSDSGYTIEVRQYRDPVGRATVRFDPTEGMVANSPFVATDTVKLQLPAQVQNLFESLDVDGDVRLDRYVYEKASDAERDTRIELRDVTAAVPLWVLFNEDRPATDDVANADLLLPIAKLSSLGGRVELVGDEIRIDVNGVMNGAPCSVRGVLTRGGEDIRSLGVDLRIEADGFPAPEGAVRNRVLADERSPEAILEFLQDYDPIGRLDVALHFKRAPNSPGTLRMDGTIRPQGVIGSARWFPFALSDVYGEVRFDGPDVRIDLHGNHGSGFAEIAGSIDRRTDYSTLDLDIRSYNIPLDVYLFMAMSERYQGVWQRFMPIGTANIHARLQRTGGPAELPRPKLQKRIVVDLRDVMALFRPYPYRIEHVDGRLVVDEDRILLRNITGLANGAPILLDGYALLDPGRDPEIEMRLEGDSLVLDARVAEAFGGPDGALARFRPRGLVNLIGSLSRREGDDELRWDLHIDARDTDINYDEFPYALSNVSADLDVQTDRVVVNRLVGRHGASTVTATASWDRQAAGDRVEMEVASDKLPLDRDLYNALPAAVKKTWDMLSPSGDIRVRSKHWFAGPSGAKTHRHETHIDPISAAVTLSAIPLPITSLTGAVIATDREVRISQLRGRVAGAEIFVDGTIQLGEPGPRGELRLTVGEFELSKQVLAALPGGLGKWLGGASPKGRLKLDLSRVAFETDANGKLGWRIEGQMDLSGVAGRFGMEMEGTAGRIKGSVVIHPDGRSQIDADAALTSMMLGGWDLRNVRSRIISEPTTGALMIQDSVARLYGGEATGSANVLFKDGGASYETSLIFRDVQVDQYLAAQRERGPRPESRIAVQQTAKGTLAGNFALHGRTGPRGFREGTGTIYVREAQVWKLPFALAIFQVLNLTPDENVFHDGRVELFLTDQTLILHKIDLQGKAMAFIGGGTLNLDSDDLDIRLLAESPVRVQVPLLTEILEGVAREVMEIHVTGTLDHPRIQPEPMRQARDVLQTLFPEVPRARR